PTGHRHPPATDCGAERSITCPLLGGPVWLDGAVAPHSWRPEQPAEGQADPFALKPWLARYSMHVVTLARSAPNEEAPAAQVQVMPLSHVLSARPDDEPARCTERHNRDYRILTELGLVVGMKPHAVVAAPVAVREDVVEGHSGPLAGAREEPKGCGCERPRLERLARVAIADVAGPGDQTRLEDPPPKEHDLTLLPGQLIAKGRQDGIGLPGRKPHRLVVEPGAECERHAHVEWAAVRIHRGGSTPIIES